MAKKFGQMRYYADEDNFTTKGKNYPLSLTKASLRSGAAFSGITPIVQLGVQTLPGTKLYINGSASPIIVGATGIYELDVDGIAYIHSIKFDSTSLDRIADKDNSAYLIIDYIYEAGEA